MATPVMRKNVRPGEAERLLEVIGARVGISDAVKHKDPTTHSEYGYDEAHALGLEGWLQTRAATIAEFCSREVYKNADALEERLDAVCEEYKIPQETATEMIDNDLPDLQAEALRVALRTYLMGFRDGRVMRLASELAEG